MLVFFETACCSGRDKSQEEKDPLVALTDLDTVNPKSPASELVYDSDHSTENAAKSNVGTKADVRLNKVEEGRFRPVGAENTKNDASETSTNKVEEKARPDTDKRVKTAADIEKLRIEKEQFYRDAKTRKSSF